MIRNLTLDEWAYHVLMTGRQLTKVARYAEVQWEGDRDGNINSLRIKGQNYMTACIDLRGTKQGERHCMMPYGQIGSSATFSGRLVQAQAQLTVVSEVLELQAQACAQLEDFRVWADGDCPCDYCRSTGATRSGPCAKCEGKGTR